MLRTGRKSGIALSDVTIMVPFDSGIVVLRYQTGIALSNEFHEGGPEYPGRVSPLRFPVENLIEPYAQGGLVGDDGPQLGEPCRIG